MAVKNDPSIDFDRVSYDFGFTAMSEQDVREIHKTSDDRAEQIAKLVLPLLRNLMKDCDTTEYIRWPNRGPVIQAQIDKITSILGQSPK